MISFLAICPHPAMLIPGVANKSDTEKISQTIIAYQKLNELFAKVKIDHAIIISPHGQINPTDVVVNISEKFTASFLRFGSTLTAEFKGNVDIANEIVRAIQVSGAGAKGIVHEDLDHGISVPMYLLTKNAATVPTITPLTYTFTYPRQQIEVGKVIGNYAKNSKLRIAIIASGDLSHKLSHASLEGYSPFGYQFDEKIIASLRAGTYEDIPVIDEFVVSNAGQCGYNSILMLLGAMESISAKKPFNVLSYEAPFGVGYLTAYYEGLN